MINWEGTLQAVSICHLLRPFHFPYSIIVGKHLAGYVLHNYGLGGNCFDYCHRQSTRSLLNLIQECQLFLRERKIYVYIRLL